MNIEEKNQKREKIEQSFQNRFSKNLIQLVEAKYLRTDLFEPNQFSKNLKNFSEEKNSKKKNENQKKRKEGVNVGDIVQIGYKIPEGDKERIQFYEGVVISKKNRTLAKTFTIRRYVQSIGLEQIFLLHSPKISSLFIKQSSKIRKAKLYFIRTLSSKSTRLKLT